MLLKLTLTSLNGEILKFTLKTQSHIKISNYLFSFLLLFCGLHLRSQNLPLTIHELSEKDGLTQSDKYFFTTDHIGFVWIGSDNGLLRFDGKSLMKYQNDPNDSTSLVENKITSKCYEDDQGNLWFSTFGALNRYNRNSNSFSSFIINEEVKDYDLFYANKSAYHLSIGSGDNRYFFLFDRDKNTFTKGTKLKGEACVPIVNKDGKPDQILSISLPNQSGLNWIDKINNKTIHVEFPKYVNGEELNFPSATRAAFIDNDGAAWIGLYDGIGIYYPGDTMGLVHFDRLNSIMPDIGWVKAINRFNDKMLLIGADNGLFLFDKEVAKIVYQFKETKGNNYPLTLKGTNHIHLDALGNIWLSGNDQKIAFANIYKNRFSKLDKTEGISFVNVQEDIHGDIWCSSIDSGTYVFSPQKELKFRTKRLKNTRHSKGSNPLPNIDFFMHNSNSEWWGNLGNYFFAWDKEQGEFILDFAYFLGVAHTGNDRINFCYELNNGKNIAALGNKIYELNLDKKKVDTLPWFSLENFNLDLIEIIYQDKEGRIYINDEYGKLLIFETNDTYLTLLAERTDIGVLNAFQEDESKEKIWVSGTRGLGFINIDSLKFEPIELFDADVSFYEIVQDLLGNLWLPTNKGLYRFDPATNQIHNFKTSDGLLSNVFNKNSSLRSSKTGELWVGGKNGINVFDPADIELLESSPKAQLTNLLVNDEAYSLTQNITETTSLEFSYSQNTLSFEFAALDYADPSCNEFVHQMVGLDDSPVPNSSRGFTRYGNIPPGDYVFKLWATNSDLVLNKTPLELSISIAPPFYQTWWFYLACLSLITAIIYGIFKYRIAQILKLERLRTRIASDLHDDVGGILSGLAMQSEILEMTAKDEEKDKLRQIADMSRNAMSGMRDTVWAIDSRKDKFEDLVDRMREHAEEVLIPKDIGYKVNDEQISMAQALPPLIRQNVYLIYKEAITNVAKHSNGDLVNIDLKMDKSNFEMRIHDNGTFEGKSYKTTGLGQSNMQMRAKNLGGSLEVDTEAGYEIILRFPSF